MDQSCFVNSIKYEYIRLEGLFWLIFWMHMTSTLAQSFDRVVASSKLTGGTVFCP